jgi:hypothetical protein
MIHNFTKWLNENSDYSTSDQLADLEHLYDLGMIDAENLLREKIKIKASLGQLTKLTYTEIELLDSELAEDIEEWVKDEAMVFTWKYESDEEEEEVENYLLEEWNVEIDWQVYPDNTIDVEVFYPNLGDTQKISWTEEDGTVKSRGVLDYYKENVVRQLNPNATTGRIKLSHYVKESIEAFFSGISNKN